MVLLEMCRNAITKQGIKATIPLPAVFTAVVLIWAIIHVIETRADPDQIVFALIITVSTFVTLYIALVVPMILLMTATVKMYYHGNGNKGRQN